MSAHGNPSSFELQVNRQRRTVHAQADTPLMYVLRNDLGLNGPRYGCGLGECGACAVLVDGVARRSCVIPVSSAQGLDIVTLEGLGSRDAPHPVQRAFVDAQAAQCGYCTNGMVIATVALLGRDPSPSDRAVRDALQHHLCRCGAHVEILEAVRLAARYSAGPVDP